MGIPFKYTIMLIIFDSEEQVFQSLPLINKLLTCMPYQFNSSTKLIPQKAFSKTSVCLKHDKLLVLTLGTTISPIFHTQHYKQASMNVLKLYNNLPVLGSYTTVCQLGLYDLCHPLENLNRYQRNI